MLHNLYRQLLELNGHKVVGVAYNGKECIDKFACDGQEPDFLLMDHKMPVKNGLETTKELLKNKPGLKIIFISGDTALKDEALGAGAVTFIEKPFDIHTLYKAIEKLL